MSKVANTVPDAEDRGPSPLVVMAVSVAARAHSYAAAYLHGRGLSPDGMALVRIWQGGNPEASRADRCIAGQREC
jgi:hypothetical protein